MATKKNTTTTTDQGAKVINPDQGVFGRTMAYIVKDETLAKTIAIGDTVRITGERNGKPVPQIGTVGYITKSRGQTALIFSSIADVQQAPMATPAAPDPTTLATLKALLAQ